MVAARYAASCRSEVRRRADGSQSRTTIVALDNRIGPPDEMTAASTAASATPPATGSIPEARVVRLR